MLNQNVRHTRGHGFDSPRGGCRCNQFERMSRWTVRAVGCRWGFRVAMLLILFWAACGPYFRYNEAWVRTFGVATSSVTVLLVCLIQNAQNRDTKSIHLKLDELILAGNNARNELINIEHLTEEQLDVLALRYSEVADRHERAFCLRAGRGEAEN
jgi:low affinity Fe/Cu permease